ncbi:Lrp/AsnC family transcriptional regulator [Photobacterium sp. NCIMB 13483]|uniref:Lrp/AsnC family transcriptional regulator n=1 Tax=Photobacterium sp. NCIMB 13483 TaxID=2022103 RepID=UPI000D15D3D9|nr:Lrp/AsnC family transcriptional regulator [Photobacterium sp. NCIMB 13483]PST86525.1 Lrp/AsnC family transcriptional regulator [Photobacterium sp. NCIMB 13483]
MDTYNERILQELTTNGKITNAELAQKIGLSASACLRRVQELESKGIIKGYRVILDYKALGRGFVAYVTVGLSTHTSEAQKSFEKAISLSQEVVECHNVTGRFEYLLRIETTDLKSYKEFHSNTLGMLPHIAMITTHVVMESTKDERA